jgi:hypothetical protein
MTVQHGLNGGNRVMVNRADHSRVFAARGRAGYVQHPYSYGGRDFGRRTYFFHGHIYGRSYMGFPYRGFYLSIYAPGFFYSPYYYGWLYNPWAPFAYGWGWAGDPWYGYYGYYFAPYPMYPSASAWLTDYMISSDLEAAYAAHTEAGEIDGAPQAAAGGAPLLTPEVKQMIADEVKNQLALENQEAQRISQKQDIDPGSSGIDRILSDAAKGKRHIFVVGAPLDVVDSSQNECSLSDGDVLALQSAPPADAQAADLVVLASKGGQECQKQATVSVALTDMQEMQNHMRETIDQGIKELQAKQGKEGIPAPPASVPSQPAQAPYDAIAPPPDPNAATEIQQQADQADQAEKDATAESTTPGGGGQ